MVLNKFAALAGSLALCALPQAALGADYPDWGWPDDMRGSYTWDDAAPETVLGFEVGLRYVYSWGNAAMNVAGNHYSIEDKSHMLEGHFRIDDYSSDVFLRGSAGMNISSDGNYMTPGNGVQTFEGGTVGTVEADLGWLGANAGPVRAGIFAGYHYMNESPDMGWTAVPAARTYNSIDIHALRLGLSARAEINDIFDISADAAIIPYAWLSGTYGAYAGGAANLEGSLYGAEGQVMVGYHFAPEAIFRVGGRASYLTGGVDVTQGGVTAPTSSLHFARLGAIAELTYAF